MRNVQYLLIAVILLSYLNSHAQPAYESPRTASGRPDLQGVFTWRTLTPLERPDTVGGRSVLSETEAAEWAAFENRRQNRDLIIDSVGGASYLPASFRTTSFGMSGATTRSRIVALRQLLTPRWKNTGTN